MDFDIDFGSTSGFKTHGKKKKAAATRFDPFAEDNEKKDDGTAENGGGNDDLGGYGGGDGGAAGGNGGDDNNNGGNDEEDDWGFSTGKKNKKKSKKKQEEEEEEERKRKEEEEAQANADPLSWADDANGEANEDWTMSWGGTGKKKDKKSKVCHPGFSKITHTNNVSQSTAPPAVPDAPPATNAFQDISLDDGAPKLDFSFDGIGNEKKNDAGGGFGAWGKSWDFGSIGKEEKKEETNDFGSNNPWGFGGSKSKSKKATTASSFDFGDFGATENNDLSFAGGEDVVDTKADDAWGFGGKKSKKKGAIEEIKEEPEPAKEEESFSGWGAAKTTKSKKKDAIEEAFSATTTNDNAFDWGFGTSKSKKKDLIGEVDDASTAKADNGDDWMSGAWGSAGNKDKKKKKNLLEDEFDPLPEAPEPPPATEPLIAWDAGLDKKAAKKKEKDMKLMGTWDNRITQEMVDAAEAEKAAGAFEPEPEPLSEESKEPLVAWDFGLSSTDKKKKSKQMKLDGTWDGRVTQEMVDEQEAAAAAAAFEPEPEPIPDPEPPPPPPAEERVPWDHGLDAKERRKKQKQMQLDGSWADRLTQEKLDQEKADAEAAAAALVVDPIDEFLQDDVQPDPTTDAAQDDTPLEDLVPWDYMLTTKEKKKKKQDMMFDGTWDDRLTEEKIAQMIADRDAQGFEAEPEPEPIPEPEPEVIPEERPEDLRPWDDGLTPKDKKKKQREMEKNGTWFDRLTQEMIDEKIAAANAAAEEPEPPPIEEDLAAPQDTPGDSLEELEKLKPWDDGLSPKEKKKKQKEMEKDGSWFDRLTQDIIDEKIAAAKAAQEAPLEVLEEPDVIIDVGDAPGESLEELEKLRPWDDGLSPIKKKAKQKQMKLEGTWEDRLTQEIIDEKIAAAKAANESEPIPEHEPEPEPEPAQEEELRVPWDFGLTLKEKKKKQKEMEKAGTWEDRLTQEQIDADVEAAASKEAEPAVEVPADNSWGFGAWGAGKTKTSKNKSLLDPEPEPIEEKVDEGWGGTWGFGKKKKEKTPEPEPEPEPVKDKADDIWSFGATSKDKKKKDKTSKTADLFDPVAEEPVPEPVAPPEDMWASIGKTDKKSKKSKKDVVDPPPPAPTPPALGLTPEPDEPAIPSVDDFSWGGLDNGKTSKKSLTEDPPAKKSSGSMWGFGSSGSASKTKKEKEAKAKKEEEERLQREAEEAEAAAKAEEERLAAEEEAAKAAKKSSKLSKTSKSSTPKVEDKKKSSDLLDLLDEPVPTPASASSKLKKSSTRSSDKKLDDLPEEAKDANTDYFSFWGGSSNAKKTPGKKSTDNKKEIKSNVLTNDEDALLAELDEDEIQAILDDAPAPTSPKLSKTMSNGKSKASSSVLDRVKAFETKKEDIGKKSKSTSATLISEEAEPELALTPKEAKKATKSKSARSSKVDQPLSPPLDEQKKSKDSVPGSFPGGFGDDDDLLADDAPPPEPSTAKKSSKTDKKVATKPSKKKTADVVTFEEPVKVVAEPEDLLDESVASPAKKERPRVERSATTSWGFWSAAPPPKKPVRSKTLEDVSPPSTKKPSVSHSKSTKVSKDKEPEEKSSKASGSDKEPSSKSTERPKPTRGNSLSSFMFGGPPPSAMRNGGSERRKSTTSRSSSRRQSLADSGVMSPPEDSPVTSKAAKLMGFSTKPSRRSSVKEKSKSYADPYPIDDDDMVMINTKDAQTPSKSKPKVVTDAKRATKVRSKTISGDEDLVMVDSPVALDSANEDFDRPKLQRSNTGSKKTGLFGSLFGGGAKLVDRTRSTPATDNEDNATPVRSRGTSRRRSTVVSPAEEPTDADVARKERRAKRAAAEKAEEEERLAREERRRQRRDREKADLEARQERAREKARKEREADEQRREERRARRKEKEAAEKEREAREMAEADAAAERRREERRKLRAQLEAEGNIPSKEDRRKSYAADEDARRRAKEGKSKSKSSGRKSTPLMAEYHESRSGSGRGIKPPEDKTSSWVDSQKDEPPEMPAIEPTVLDESGQAPRPVDDPERRRRRKDKDKYAGMTEDEIAEARAKRRERRVTEKSASGGSGGSDEKDAKRSSKRQSRVYEDDFYTNADPVKTFDGRPQTTKRSSFLGKFF